MEEFLTALREVGLVDDLGDIVLERYEGAGYQSVSPDIFASMFGAILDDPDVADKYSGLLAADVDPIGGGSRGYRRFLEAWHEQGLI